MTEHFAIVGRKNSLLTGKVPITVSGRGGFSAANSWRVKGKKNKRKKR